jgi:putative Mg2+ transporter-C (MgtC) family protein
MRTYGLVCMASTGLTAIVGFPSLWYGGAHGLAAVAADPTRVVQGIVTGIGFLGAGVIMKEGLSISGLTTAASIWAASSIGVLIGVGFYASAILLAMLSSGAMLWGAKVESWLPSHPAVGLTLRFAPAVDPDVESLDSLLFHEGYQLARGSLSVAGAHGAVEWRCVVTAIHHRRASSLDKLSRALQDHPGVEGWSAAYARN